MTVSQPAGGASFTPSTSAPSSTALVLGWRTLCRFERTGIGWLGPDHCHQCAEETERGCAAFAAAVLRGEFDEQGYTPAERRAQMKRKKHQLERRAGG